jgi:hypothetical protein
MVWNSPLKPSHEQFGTLSAAAGKLHNHVVCWILRDEHRDVDTASLFDRLVLLPFSALD